MALRLGQLIHTIFDGTGFDGTGFDGTGFDGTGFDGTGFRTLSSAEVPLSIQKAFAARIVRQYWNVRPHSSDCQAVYLHQVSPTELLFGWLYNDEADGIRQEYAPYFVCYYWVGILNPMQLKSLLACLRIGPVALLDRHSLPESIESVVITDPYRYRSARPGIAIPPEVEEQSARLLEQGEVLQWCVAIDLAAKPPEETSTLPSFASALAVRAIVRSEPRSIEPIDYRSSEPFSPAKFSLGQSESRQLLEEAKTEAKREEAISQTNHQANYQANHQTKQASLAQSSRIRVLGTLLLLAVMVSGFYVIRLFSATLGGKLAPREKLVPEEKLAPRGKLSSGGKSAIEEEQASAEQRAKLTPTSATSTVLPATVLPTLTLAQTLIGHTDAVWSVALSANGQRLFSSGADCMIKVWDLQTGQVVSTLSGHKDIIRSIALSPDGQTLVSGSGDKTIKIWNLQTNTLTSTLESTSPIWSVAFSRDGQTVVSGSNTGTLSFWQMSTGKLLHKVQGHTSRIFSVAVSPDGQTVATGSLDKTVKLWNFQTGKRLRTLLDPSAVRSVAFSPNGQTLASGSWDQTVKLWDWQNGTLLHKLVGHSDRVVAVAFTDNGETLVSGSTDTTIKRWSAHTGQLLQTIDDSPNWVLAIASNATEIVGGGKDKKLRIWR